MVAVNGKSLPKVNLTTILGEIELSVSNGDQTIRMGLTIEGTRELADLANQVADAAEGFQENLQDF